MLFDNEKTISVTRKVDFRLEISKRAIGMIGAPLIGALLKIQ